MAGFTTVLAEVLSNTALHLFKGNLEDGNAVWGIHRITASNGGTLGLL